MTLGARRDIDALGERLAATWDPTPDDLEAFQAFMAERQAALLEVWTRIRARSRGWPSLPA